MTSPMRYVQIRMRVAASLAVCGWWAASAGAQPQQAAAVAEARHNGTVALEISELSQQGELIRVAVNKAVLLKFNYPVNEVTLVKPEIAEVTASSPYQLVVTGKSFGTTQLIVRLNESIHRVYDIAVDVELERLAASIRTAVPRAKVKVHALLDAVMLTGTAPDTDSADRIVEIAGIFSEKVINHIEVAGAQQVLLRCTVAEVNRSATRALGFNGWLAGDNVPSAFGVSNIGGINPTNIGAVGGAIVSPPQALPGTVEASIAGLVPFATDIDGLSVEPTTTLSVGFPEVPMQIFVRALRENGLLKVLAEPNLVAISGEPAEFLAGGSFPIPVPQDADTITIEFRDFGVKLNFTPAVLSEGRIRLQVRPEVSEPDFSTAVNIGGFVVPGLVERRIETVVEVGSGQTIALGGMLSERTRGVSQKVPGLGDLPVLGPLFSSVEYQQEESEMIVLVTPELVGPISSQQVTHIPGANLSEPNDFELFLLGKLNSETNQPALRPHPTRTWPNQNQRPEQAAPEMSAAKLRGPVGPAGFAEGS